MELTKKEIVFFIVAFALIVAMIFGIPYMAKDRSEFVVLSCQQEDDTIAVEVSFINRGDCARAPSVSFIYKATQDGVTIRDHSPYQKTYNNEVSREVPVTFRVYFDTKDLDVDKPFLFTIEDLRERSFIQTYLSPS